MRLTAIALFAVPLVAAGLAVTVDRGEAQTSEMLLHSPRNYQVFQRETRLRGAVRISGRVMTACDKVEARITGTALSGALPDRWQAVSLERETLSFHGLIPTAAGGWYQVEVRVRRSGKTVAQATVEKVGVGEVFVGAGQSNSTNSGEQRSPRPAAWSPASAGAIGALPTIRSPARTTGAAAAASGPRSATRSMRSIAFRSAWQSPGMAEPASNSGSRTANCSTG